MGGLIVLRGVAWFVFVVTRSPRAGRVFRKIDGLVERDRAAQFSAQYWDLERREAAVKRNAAVEARRRQRRLHEAD